MGTSEPLPQRPYVQVTETASTGVPAETHSKGSGKDAATHSSGGSPLEGNIPLEGSPLAGNTPILIKGVGSGLHMVLLLSSCLAAWMLLHYYIPDFKMWHCHAYILTFYSCFTVLSLYVYQCDV